MEDLLGIDYQKFGTPLVPIFETPPIKVEYCDKYIMNEKKILEFYKKSYWINYVPFIAKYYEAYIESEKNDIKEVFSKIPEKNEENMAKILEVEDFRKFQMYCIAQSFLFKEKQDRSDSDKKKMKIIDLKFTNEAEKMIRKYVINQYSNDYAFRVQQRNKELLRYQSLLWLATQICHPLILPNKAFVLDSLFHGLF